MKIILLKDVPKIGKKYDVKNVSDGYALNFLFPKNLAQVATDKSLKQIETEKENALNKKKLEEEILNKEIKRLADVKLEIKSKTNKEGGLFAGIDKKEIGKVLKENTGIDIDQGSILMDKPIKEIGEHYIKIKIGNKEAKIKVEIMSV